MARRIKIENDHLIVFFFYLRLSFSLNFGKKMHRQNMSLKDFDALYHQKKKKKIDHCEVGFNASIDFNYYILLLSWIASNSCTWCNTFNWVAHSKWFSFLSILSQKLSVFDLSVNWRTFYLYTTDWWIDWNQCRIKEFHSSDSWFEWGKIRSGHFNLHFFFFWIDCQPCLIRDFPYIFLSLANFPFLLASLS